MAKLKASSGARGAWPEATQLIRLDGLFALIREKL
jgi:hypothetical protein